MNSSEAASEYVVALGVAGSGGGSAIGASIAYNYLGGLSPLDPNVLSYTDGVLPGSTTVSVTSDNPIPVDTEIDLPDSWLCHRGRGRLPCRRRHPHRRPGRWPDVLRHRGRSQPHPAGLDHRQRHGPGTAIPISSTGSTSSSQTFTLTKLQSTPAVTFNPTNSSISGNEIYLFSVTQSSGTLVVNYNVPLPGTAPNIQVSGSASSALFGSSPATTSNSITGSERRRRIPPRLPAATNTLAVTVNGTPLTTITLAPGTYTPAGLAAELQKELNGAIFTQDGLTRAAKSWSTITPAAPASMA